MSCQVSDCSIRPSPCALELTEGFLIDPCKEGKSGTQGQKRGQDKKKGGRGGGHAGLSVQSLGQLAQPEFLRFEVTYSHFHSLPFLICLRVVQMLA